MSMFCLKESPGDARALGKILPGAVSPKDGTATVRNDKNRMKEGDVIG